MLICRNDRYTQMTETFETVEAFQAMCLASFGRHANLTHQPLNGRWIDETGAVVLVENGDDLDPVTVSANKKADAATVTIRARAFQGRLETIKAQVDGDAVRVYDEVAGHYTTCHSLSARDIGRIRAAAARA